MIPFHSGNEKNESNRKHGCYGHRVVVENCVVPTKEREKVLSIRNTVYLDFGGDYITIYLSEFMDLYNMDLYNIQGEFYSKLHFNKPDFQKQFIGYRRKKNEGKEYNIFLNFTSFEKIVTSAES